MCTAATYKTKDFYFGRTLDYEFSYQEEVTVTPRNYSLAFQNGRVLENHYAIIGMAYVVDGYPLYYDGVNEMGVAIAGLNFVGNAVYGKAMPGKDNIAQFEFIPWVLAQCADLGEVRTLLTNINLTDTSFRSDLPIAQLHWMIADREGCIVVEAMADGLHIHENPVGVMTNNPTFDRQLLRLCDYQQLSAKEPENRFAKGLELKTYSRGMGAMGLPGDLSSTSRFVRVAFVKENSHSGEGEEESVSQFFHILGSVDQQRGCCEVREGEYEITIYTCCCNCDKGIYYYTTYDNQQITAVDMHRENLNGSALCRYRLITGQQIRLQN